MSSLPWGLSSVLAVVAVAVAACSSPPPIQVAAQSRVKYEVSPQFASSRPQRVALVWQTSYHPSTDASMTRVLLGKGYRVAERQRLDRVLEEIKFQVNGLTQASANRIATLLNVDAIVLAYQDEWSVSCRLIELTSAEILFSSSNCIYNFPERSYADRD